jgi:hypothetical protein
MWVKNREKESGNVSIIATKSGTVPIISISNFYTIEKKPHFYTASGLITPENFTDFQKVILLILNYID